MEKYQLSWSKKQPHLLGHETGDVPQARVRSTPNPTSHPVVSEVDPITAE